MQPLRLHPKPIQPDQGEWGAYKSVFKTSLECKLSARKGLLSVLLTDEFSRYIADAQ